MRQSRGPIILPHELLVSAPMFCDLPPTLVGRLATNMRQQAVKRGETLFRQQEEAQACFVIVSGRARLVQHTAEGRDVTMATFVSGEVIGLVMALFGRPYPGTAEVLEDGEALIVPREVLWSMVAECPSFAIRVIKMLGERLEDAHNRIRELSVERVQQRIARALVRLIDKVGVGDGNGAMRLDVRLSRQDIAQMAGTTLETVSRTLTAWGRDGIVDARREQIAICNLEALFAIAEDSPSRPGHDLRTLICVKEFNRHRRYDTGSDI